MSCRRTAHQALDQCRERPRPEPLLCEHLPVMCVEARLHARQRATGHALGTRACRGSHAGQARPHARRHAGPAANHRACVRHDQGLDGAEPLQDKNASAVSDASARTVFARSPAEIPVVRPSRPSTLTVKAVLIGSKLLATMGGRFRRSARLDDIGAQMIPLVWRTMNAIRSGVRVATHYEVDLVLPIGVIYDNDRFSPRDRCYRIGDRVGCESLIHQHTLAAREHPRLSRDQAFDAMRARHRRERGLFEALSLGVRDLLEHVAPGLLNGIRDIAPAGADCLYPGWA